MVAYNFQKRFIAPIRAGTKRHTIRAERKGKARHARPGELVQLYFGMRTKHCRLIAEPLCDRVEPVRIDLGADLLSVGAECYRSVGALDAVAVSDGFADWDDMNAFWRREHTGVIVFEGSMIIWAPIAVFPEAAADLTRGGADVPVP